MNVASNREPMTLILTHAMCRQSSASGRLNLSNAWNGSKLFINHDHPQVHEFKSRFDVPLPSQNMSQALSLNYGSSGAFEGRTFSFVKDVMSISDMLALKDESFCNTFGTTKRFNRNRLSWYYEVCPTCNTTNKFPSSTFECKCGENTLQLITKFKIVIEVEHENKVGNFMFWDKGCIPYVGMSAQELRELMKKIGQDVESYAWMSSCTIHHHLLGILVKEHNGSLARRCTLRNNEHIPHSYYFQRLFCVAYVAWLTFRAE